MSQQGDEFKNTVFVRFAMRCPSNFKAIPQALLEELLQDGETSSKMKARKELFNGEKLDTIRSAMINGRNTILKKYCLPFPVHGVMVVRKDRAKALFDAVEELKAEVQEKVNEFMVLYPDLVSAARSALPEALFSGMDYKSFDQMQSSFGITLQFFEMGHASGLYAFDESLYEQAKAEFYNLKQEARAVCVNALREGFLEIVKNLSDRLREGKRFKQTSIDNITEYLDHFENIHIFDDTELRKIISSAKKIIGTNSANDLREDETMRSRIGQELSVVSQALASKMQQAQGRKITFVGE